ncbi:MAG TPA: hypothetical protein VGH28_12585 [Polyangiaceae bacterium]|jgi:hypothetical protein
MTLLLIVEDTFAIRERGLVLAPFLPPAEVRRGRFSVEVHRPDGTILPAAAVAQIAFAQPTPREPRVHVMLLAVAKGEVPIGSKVYVA